MKVIIAGGRDFNNYNLLKSEILKLFDITKIEVVSGGARGADRLGEQLAKEYKLPLNIFPAEWNVFGKSAGYIRNVKMAEYATHLVAFWDGYSRGTEHMINIANEKGLTINIVRYDSNTIR